MSLIFAMALFSLSMSISPGPVNLIALTSGVNNGFWIAMRFVSGATFGFVALLLLVGGGMNLLMQTLPELLEILRLAGSLFITYLGVKVLMSEAVHIDAEQNAQPPTFLQGVLLQWLNPKAWIACVAGCSAFSVDGMGNVLLLFAGVYFVFCYLGITFWAVAGDNISRWLSSPHQVTMFNRVMGLSLIGVAVYLILH